MECVGKSTIVEILRRSQRLPKGTLFTREPTARFLRSKEESIHGDALFKLIVEDRAQHIEKDIIPELKIGTLVISDRYIPSTFVSQGVDGVSLDAIWEANKDFLVPNITFFITARAC